MRNKDETLYILLRTDMASMTPGRAAAQSSHITSAFTADAENWTGEGFEAQRRWMNMTGDSFGTAIVLGGSFQEIRDTLDIASMFNYNHGARIVHDPTYAVWDGDVVHLVDIPVGGYFFTEDRTRVKEDRITAGLELF